MRLLVFGDTHLKPSGKSLSYEELELPPNTDGIVTVGDVVHRTTPKSIAAGREFMSSLENLGVPVYTVPGNHDPFPDHQSMIDGLPSTEMLHDTVIELQGVDLVGWGCGQFDAEPEVKCRAFESLDPRNESDDRRHAADRNAARLENALYNYVTNKIGEKELARELDISKAERKVLADQLAELEQVFDQLDRLLERASSPTMLLTHVPPYGTKLDRHHSIGERTADLEGLHAGSIALKLALRVHRPAVALSGHSHRREYEILADSESPIHMLNTGYEGIATVEYEPQTQGFSYICHNK